MERPGSDPGAAVGPTPDPANVEAKRDRMKAAIGDWLASQTGAAVEASKINTVVNFLEANLPFIRGLIGL